MPPNQKEDETIYEEKYEKLIAPQASPRKHEIIYTRILSYIFIHVAGLYGFYLCFTSAKWATIIFSYVLFVISEIGVTAGAHRLWSHKAYKATKPLQILLLFFNCVACQYSVYDWVRNHRMHHKFSETDADPHNATRGLFFSHIGWNFVKKHPEISKRGACIDLSDICNNPLLMFQKKYEPQLLIGLSFIVPTLIPMFFWDESFINAWHVNQFKFIFLINCTFSINSLAHYWGSKPYDKSIAPSQNLAVSFLMSGEGFHNYHHTGPWDYRAAELGNNWLNFSAKFIDFFAWIGWAYDLKTASDEIVKKTMNRKGDGTNLWGWNEEQEEILDENNNAISKKEVAFQKCKNNKL